MGEESKSYNDFVRRLMEDFLQIMDETSTDESVNISCIVKKDREEPISSDDVLNLKIALNSNNFWNELEKL